MSDRPDPLPPSLKGNIEYWTTVNREYGDAEAKRQWLAEHISWGQFGVARGGHRLAAG